MKKTVSCFLIAFVAFGVSGCKPDKKLVALPMTKAMSGVEAPCETMAWGGFPRLKESSSVSTSFICRSAYALNYNTARNTSDWVVARLTMPGGDSVDETRSDPDLPKSAQVTPSDYLGIGYQKGFFLSPYNYNDPVAQSHAYYLSNMYPQDPGQALAWKTLDKWVQSQVLAKKELYVISGPIYENGEGLGWVGVGQYARASGKTSMLGKIQVPTATFKIIISPAQKMALGFIVPNKSVAPAVGSFVASVNEIEQKTGLLFFPDQPATVQQSMKTNRSWR